MPPRLPENALRRSLYARSALFVLMGSGAFFGALFVLSALIVEDAERRLLAERSDLVQVAGAFLEGRIREDLNHLVEAARSALQTPEVDCTQFRDAARRTFTEGAVVFDAEGRPRAASAGDPARLSVALQAEPLLARVRATHDVVVSELVIVDERSVLVLAAEVTSAQGLIGYVLGALRPEARDLLEPLRRTRSTHPTELTLVDLRGIVVASTDPRRLFESADHKGLLSRAIERRKPFQGRCHSCHEEATDAPGSAPDGSAGGGPRGGHGGGLRRSPPTDAAGEGAGAENQRDIDREVEVLAFAPLPTLDLGLSVLEPESSALAPALALRRHLWQMGGALVGLFMLFAALSVRSVVRPIRRLTRAVAQAERDHTSVKPAAFGRDEIGELATALDLWRGRMIESLGAAERSRAELQAEGEAIRRHVEALRDISELSMRDPELSTLVEQSLARALLAVGLSHGALRVTDRGRTCAAARGFSPADATSVLDRAETNTSPPVPVGDEPALRPLPAPNGAGNTPPLLAATVSPFRGLRLTLVVAVTREPRDGLGLWLGALFRQICLCTSHVLVRDADRERQQTQQSVLQRVLKAQEDERSRVARDLHDTVAQDLAALRLELERLAGREIDLGARERLNALEGRAREMLATVRNILLDLRLSLLETMGLVPAMRWMLERTTREHAVPTHFMLDGDESLDVPYETGVMLFRILQEALMNAVQHAGPDHVFVTLHLQPAQIELTIEDDGRGFDPEILHRPHPGGLGRGLGLHGIDERARILGGALEVTSAPGEGATLRIRVPRPGPAPREYTP